MRNFLEGLNVFFNAVLTLTVLITWWDTRKTRQAVKAVKKEVDAILSVTVNGTTDYPPPSLK